MLSRNSFLAAGAFGLVLFMLAPLAADEKKDDKNKPGLTGTWEKKAGEMRIEFVDKEVVKFHPHGDKIVFAIVCKYSVQKDGVVKATIDDFIAKEEIKEKAKASIPIGLAFTFKWQAKNDAATLEDVKGDNVETLKSHLEGDFELKK
jgi:hypothetical protein